MCMFMYTHVHVLVCVGVSAHACMCRCVDMHMGVKTATKGTKGMYVRFLEPLEAARQKRLDVDRLKTPHCRKDSTTKEGWKAHVACHA